MSASSSRPRRGQERKCPKTIGKPQVFEGPWRERLDSGRWGRDDLGGVLGHLGAVLSSLGAVLIDLWVVLGRDEADMRSEAKMSKNYRKTIGF